MSQVVSADAEGQPAHRRPALGGFRAADAQRDHGRRHRPGFLPRHLRPVQPELRGRHQQQPGVLLGDQGPHDAGLRLQHGFDSGIPGGLQQLQRGAGPGGGRRGQRRDQVRHQRDSRRPVLLPALSHAERARSARRSRAASTPSRSTSSSSSAAASAARSSRTSCSTFSPTKVRAR